MRAAKKIIGDEIDDQSILIIMGAGSVGNFVQQFLG
jgi:UDP-N-acetylmuramate-alanine ligase